MYGEAHTTDLLLAECGHLDSGLTVLKLQGGSASRQIYVLEISSKSENFYLLSTLSESPSRTPLLRLVSFANCDFFAPNLANNNVVVCCHRIFRMVVAFHIENLSSARQEGATPSSVRQGGVTPPCRVELVFFDVAGWVSPFLMH